MKKTILILSVLLFATCKKTETLQPSTASGGAGYISRYYQVAGNIGTGANDSVKLIDANHFSPLLMLYMGDYGNTIPFTRYVDSVNVTSQYDLTNTFHMTAFGRFAGEYLYLKIYKWNATNYIVYNSYYITYKKY